MPKRPLHLPGSDDNTKTGLLEITVENGVRISADWEVSLGHQTRAYFTGDVIYLVRWERSAGMRKWREVAHGKAWLERADLKRLIGVMEAAAKPRRTARKRRA